MHDMVELLSLVFQSCESWGKGKPQKGSSDGPGTFLWGFLYYSKQMHVQVYIDSYEIIK